MTGTELVVLLSAIASIALVNWYFFVAGRTVATAMPAVAATAATGGASAAISEVVIVVDGGYTPNTIRAKAGQPLRLVFDRRDDSSCAEEVVIPAFGIKRFLPDGARTAIEITPREPGRVPFTCGMGMLKGSIIVEA